MGSSRTGTNALKILGKAKKAKEGETALVVLGVPTAPAAWVGTGLGRGQLPAAGRALPAGKAPLPGCGFAAAQEERDGEAWPGLAAPAAQSSSQQPLF